MQIFGYELKKAAETKPTAKRSPTRRRYYKGGTVDRLTAGWSVTPISPDEAARMHLRPMRARSRSICANNPYARKFKVMARTNLVGSRGVRLQARSRDLNGKPDKAANQAIEDAFLEWGETKACDIEGKLTWTQMQDLYAGTVAEDGESLLMKVLGKEAGPWGFALQFLDPELLDVDKNEDMRDGRYIRMGIEFDTWRRPLAYHLLDIPPNLLSGNLRSTRHRIIPANRIIHGFIKERVGQSRGIPWIHAAMLQLQHQGEFELAALVNARSGAGKMGFYTSEDGTEYTGDDETDEGELIEEVDPGTMRVLPRGVGFQTYDPTYPSGEFDPFQRAMLRGISSGVCVSYASLSGDQSQGNFSMGRTALVEERDIWEMLQESVMVDDFCRPVFDSWLPVQLLREGITVNGSPLPLAREQKYRRVAWQPRRWKWIDPLKDVEANVIAVNNRFRSRGSVIREQGEDPDDVWEETARDDEQLATLKIPPVAPAGEAKKPEPPDDEKEKD